MFGRKRQAAEASPESDQTAADPAESSVAPPEAAGRRGCLPRRCRKPKPTLEPKPKQRRRKTQKTQPTLETKVQLVDDEHPSPPTQPTEPTQPE